MRCRINTFIALQGYREHGNSGVQKSWNYNKEIIILQETFYF